ncbi:MAG: cyclodeaminase/cyclohydrolase family protein [Candidatus Omnitrophota bacterium]
MYADDLKKYLDDLAAKKPAPGGGSAAALVASAGVALLSMVANFTVGKEKYKAVEEEIKKTLASTEELREHLLRQVDEDVAGYKKVASAYALAKESAADNKKRDEVLQEAFREALIAPLEVCKSCFRAIKLCSLLAEKGNIKLVSDVRVALECLAAAFQSALINVEINLNYIADKTFIIEIREILDPLEVEIGVIKDEVLMITKQKMMSELEKKGEGK